MKTSYQTENTQIIDIAHGGTGATSAANALANLEAARTTYGNGGAEGFIRNDFGLEDQLFAIQAKASGNASIAGQTQWFVVRDDGFNLWNATQAKMIWDLSVPIPLSKGGTGGTSLETGLKNMHISYANGEVFSASSYVSNGFVTENTTRLYIPINTPRDMRYVNNFTLTIFNVCARTLKGYIDGGSYQKRNFKASPYSIFQIRKIHPNCLGIIVQKSSAFTNVDNNTPVAFEIDFSVTMNT